MIAAGIGCRKGADGEAVVAAVDAALAAHRLSRGDLAMLATAAAKAAEPGILEAALMLAVPLRAYEADALARFDAVTPTRSERSLDAAGVGSVSEASALAAAGAGARLLGARLALNNVTCALAASETRP